MEAVPWLWADTILGVCFVYMKECVHLWKLYVKVNRNEKHVCLCMCECVYRYCRTWVCLSTWGGVRKGLYRQRAKAELRAAVVCLHCVLDLWWGKEDLPSGDTKKAAWLRREERDSHLMLSLNCALSPGWLFSIGCYQVWLPGQGQDAPQPWSSKSTPMTEPMIGPSMLAPAVPFPGNLLLLRSQ